MTRRYANLTGYPLEVPGLPGPLPPGGEVPESAIALQHDPAQGGSVTGLTLLDEPPPKPAKKTTTTAGTEDTAGKGETK